MVVPYYTTKNLIFQATGSSKIDCHKPDILFYAKETDKHFLHFNIAGFTCYGGAEVFYKLKIGEFALTLTQQQYRVQAKIYKDIYKFLLLGHDDIFVARINSMIDKESPEKQIGIAVKIKVKTA
jgi:hypothetical protein